MFLGLNINTKNSSRFALASINCLVRYHPVNGYKKCLEYLVLRSECEKFQLALRARISVGLQVDIHPVHGYKECLEYPLFRSEYQKLSASASRSHQLIVKLDTSLFMVTKCALNVQFSGRNIKKFQLALRARNYCLKHTACSLYKKKNRVGLSSFQVGISKMLSSRFALAFFDW